MGIASEESANKSAAVILKYQQASGAYPASPTFAVYEYSWFRDGSFTADAMSRIGEVESAERFFDWCARIVLRQRDAIYNGETLDARYAYDGTRPLVEWASFQLDGFGVLLWALKGHSVRHAKSLEPYSELIELLQYYVARHWCEPSYDWWEERMGTYAASLACMYAGLCAHNHPDAELVKNAIHLSDERTDASLLTCLLFDAMPEAAFAPMLTKIEQELVASDGGVWRYADDSYYGGGEWPVLTALLGLCYVKLGRLEEARQKLDWCLNAMQDNGWLAEQQPAHLRHPEAYDFWLNKWGAPANPLLWSQAMVVTLACELAR
jgi:GH15 family glucan-1,4-alpha-glucosidase